MSIELASRTTKLSKNRISLEQKIKILEDFFQTGGELKGTTMFQGYPVGLWAVQIRSAIRGMSKGQIRKF